MRNLKRYGKNSNAALCTATKPRSRRGEPRLIKIVDQFPKEKREETLFDQWNLKQVLIHMSRWDNCLSDNVEFLKGGDRLIKTYGSLTESLWNQKFWKDKNSTPEKFLKIVTNHYKEEHLPTVKNIWGK